MHDISRSVCWVPLSGFHHGRSHFPGHLQASAPVAPSGLPPQRLEGVHDGLLQEARAATATGDFWLVREVLAWEKDNDFFMHSVNSMGHLHRPDRFNMSGWGFSVIVVDLSRR